MSTIGAVELGDGFYLVAVEQGGQIVCDIVIGPCESKEEAVTAAAELLGARVGAKCPPRPQAEEPRPNCPPPRTLQ